MSLINLFYSQSQRNDVRDCNKFDEFSQLAPEYDHSIFLTGDGKIVLVTETSATPNPESDYDDFHSMGSSEEDHCLVNHFEITEYGKKWAAKIGIPSTYDAFYKEAVKNLPRQQVSNMALEVSQKVSALTNEIS